MKDRATAAGTFESCRSLIGMPDVLKYLGGALRRTYDKVVGKPLPWSMIDKLESLDERVTQDRAVHDGDGASHGMSRGTTDTSETQPGFDTNAKP